VQDHARESEVSTEHICDINHINHIKLFPTFVAKRAQHSVMGSFKESICNLQSKFYRIAPE
jgi:hypothetical protein